MKLYAITQSDLHGREAKKGGDTEIMTRYYNGNIPVFEVTFKDDGHKRGYLEIMSYSDGQKKIVYYSDNDTRTT